ncbi:MAG: hypothetical protein ACK4UJ_07405 [Leptonema sp. (in: bacteria)]
MKNHFYLIFLLSLNCLAFGVQDLEENVIFSLELQKENEVQLDKFILPISIQDNVIYSLPQEPVLFKNELLLPIPEKNFYVYFRKPKQPEFLLTPKNTKDEIQKKNLKIPLVLLPTGIIGKACITEEYLVFQIFQQKDTSKLLEPEEPENRLPAILYPETKEENPSKVYLIKKTDLKMGENAFLLLTKNDPYKINKLLCAENQIFLFNRISGNNQQVEVYDYNQNVTKFEISTDFLNNQKDRVMIENVEPLMKGDQVSFLVEVVFRNTGNFKILNKNYYEYYKDNYQNVITNSDANFSLIGVTDAGIIYLGTNEGDKLIIRIYDSDYKYLKKVRIHFNFVDFFWKEFFINREGRFFSTKIEESIYKIVEWK